MLILIYTFLLIAGIFRYRDGCRRLRCMQEKDVRYTQIPDADVVEWWHRVSYLDHWFGIFFKWYGLFLIIASLFNLLLSLKIELEIQLNKFIIIYSLVFIITAIIGIAIISDNDSGLYPKGIWPLNFNLQKDDMIQKYKWQNFLPYADWSDKNFFSNKYIFCADSVRKGNKRLLTGSKRIKFGAILYYGNWLVLIFILTSYNIFS